MDFRAKEFANLYALKGASRQLGVIGCTFGIDLRCCNNSLLNTLICGETRHVLVFL